MSELKDYWIPTRSGNVCHCYIKSEADKVIAEKDAVIAGLKRENKRLEKEASCTFADDCLRLRQTKRKLRRQKYKRCLDNAWWCRNLSNAYAWSASNLRGWKIAVYYDKKAELYRKWHKRWLELAEKFKEAK